MMTNQLYNTWIQQISKLRPGQRITQIRNFVWLMIGIYQSHSVCLSRIAGKIPGKVQLLSYTRRLSRFLNNPSIDVREWYQPIAKSWIEKQAQYLQQVRLIVDGTKVGFGHQLLMVSLAYRKRAIPLAWSWVPQVRGHSTAQKQLALLTYVHSLMPTGIAALLVGDTEFGSVSVLQQLDQWRWHYVLRQKSSTKICLAAETKWYPFGNSVQKASDSHWLGKGWLTESLIYPVNLLAHWKRGEKEAWFLATNLPDKQMAIQAYARRMWIEEMFGDMKGHGFDLEKTMLRHEVRLSRLTLAVAILYVWLVSTGTRTIRNGKRFLVDRRARRDLCIFQIGLRFIDRQLINSLNFQISLCSYR